MHASRLVSAAGFLLAIALVAPAAFSQDQMATYQLILLETGPDRPAEMPPGGDDLHKQHLAYFDRLQSDGSALVLGPFGGDGPARGVMVMRRASAAEATAIVEADPSVKAGRLVPRVMVLWAAADAFQKPAAAGGTEQLYFGFLNTGPDRTQDAEAAKRLQAEHLAYMADRHKEGRLVAAGPIGEGGEHRRGIVVYRAASLEEARTFAEGDPAVKAGRLAVELHAWTVPRGVFP